MRTSIWILLFGLLAVFLQGTVFRTFLPDFLVPNLMVCLAVFLAFYDNSPFGAILVFMLGLELDFYSGRPPLIGPSAGALLAVFGVLASLSQRVYIESSFAIFVIAVLSAIFNSIVHVILTYELNESMARFFSVSLLSVFITGLVTPFIFRALEMFFGRRDAGSARKRTRSIRV